MEYKGGRVDENKREFKLNLHILAEMNFYESLKDAEI
jgi:hypothetical protein